MKYLLAPLLALSLVGCSLFDGPVVSEIEPSGTPSPIASPADLLVFGGFDPRYRGLLSESFVKLIYQGYQLSLDEVHGEVAGMRVGLVPAIPDALADRLLGEGGYGEVQDLTEAVIAYAENEPRFVADMGPNHWRARDDGSIRALCQAGIVMISSTLADPSASASGCPTQRLFRTAGSVGSSGRAAAQYFQDTGVKRVLLLTSRADSDRQLPVWKAQLSAFTAAARAVGVQIVDQRDLIKTTASQIRSLNPEAVFFIGLSDRVEAAALWKLRSEVAAIPFMINDMSLTDDFDLIGRQYSPEGPMLLSTFAFEPSSYIGYQDFLQRWDSRFGEEIRFGDVGIAMDSYAAMKALLTAIEQVASSGIRDPREIAARLPGVLASLKLSGAPYGEPWGFTGSGDRYPVIGGIYTVDLTLSEDLYLFPLRAVRYE